MTSAIPEEPCTSCGDIEQEQVGDLCLDCYLVEAEVRGAAGRPCVCGARWRKNNTRVHAPGCPLMAAQDRAAALLTQ